MEKKREIVILITAHNEEKVVGSTISSLLKLLPAKDIYLVSDGSSDSTALVARRFTSNVYSLRGNVGKATATNMAIDYFNLPRKYEYIMPMDADTMVSPKYLKKALPILKNDVSKKLVCVVGKVLGKNHSWITTYRLWEYEIAQSIHKAAQAREGAIVVCPGCATVYRSSVFQKIKIPTGTLTEDMDFTFLIHRKRLGKIAYLNSATVTTQDPNNLKDFLKQIDRWYTGFWQCLVKHNIPWGGQPLDAEVALLASEGIFNGLLVISLLFLIPLTISKNVSLLLIPFSADLLLFLIPTMILTGKRHHAWNIFKYLPHFYFMRIASSLIFLRSFFKIVIGADLKMKWNKVARYEVIS